MMIVDDDDDDDNVKLNYLLLIPNLLKVSWKYTTVGEFGLVLSLFHQS